MLLLFLVASEDTQQVEEEVDEVEIQAQRTKQSELLHVFACVGRKLAHLLYLLRVVCGETHEDEHA